MKILKSSLVASILGLILYVVVTALLWKAPPIVVKEGEPAEDHAPLVVNAKGPSWEFQNPEMDLLLTELKAEKASLAKRENDLKELAERLNAERLEINVVTQAVYQLQTQVEANIAKSRAELEATIVRVNAEEGPNIKKLSRTYAAMTPDGAAAIMKELDESILVKILAVMKESENAAILETMAKLGPEDAKRVAKVTERLRSYLPQPKDAKKNL